MTLEEYGSLLAIVIPTDYEYEYVALDDDDRILLFGSKPEYRKVGDSFTWESDDFIGCVKIFNNFIDLRGMRNPDTGDVDWSLAVAEVPNKPFNGESTLIRLAEWLNCILPHDVEYATFSDGIFEMWKSEPLKSNGEWVMPDGRMPIAKLYISEELMVSGDGEKYEIIGENAVKEE